MSSANQEKDITSNDVKADIGESSAKSSKNKKGKFNKNFRQGRTNQVPSKLPPPRFNTDSTTPLTTTVGFETCFVRNVSNKEKMNNTTFSVSMSSFNDIIDVVYEQLCRNSSLRQEVTIYTFRYYASVLAWLRLITIRFQNDKVLNATEKAILAIAKSNEFVVPEPLLIYFRSLGNIRTVAGQHLRLSVASYPNHVIDGLGGFYDDLEIDQTLYEEVPSVGLYAEVLMNSLDGLEYYSRCDTDNYHANEFALGYVDTFIPSDDNAIQRLLDYGITGDVFPETVPDSAINVDILLYVSENLNTTTIFKNTTVNFSSLAISGITVRRSL